LGQFLRTHQVARLAKRDGALAEKPHVVNELVDQRSVGRAEFLEMLLQPVDLAVKDQGFAIGLDNPQELVVGDHAPAAHHPKLAP